ncbi:uncharacterized protein PV07_11418 [Cladophialophora immunda]|uniref:DUF202 domain-containing protein n=1 Tax=Cladophialophora immunda TaxID=569365 RepID=A0A0D2BVU3_9EURO|nr:uncharacterized protein PV07_11418 [Cladophialophora immunda]KIW23198.1 hypothetical protein PV07_11418 [Cladophialophora immunda]OQV07150.1 hypothetical protein CLAIMM_11625 [Cladophialophora immunda]
MAIRRRLHSSSAVIQMNDDRHTTTIYQSYPPSPRLASSSTLDATSDYVEIARQFWDGLEQTPTATTKPRDARENWSLKKFWDEYVAVEMEFGYNVREHITNEETFISWFEFGFGMAGFGLVVLQFGILNGRLVDSADAVQLAKAMACTSFVLAILSVVVGAYRFFRQQNALFRGQIFLRGLSMFFVILLFSMVLVASMIINWIGII